jgi:hypothetical protein
MEVDSDNLIAFFGLNFDTGFESFLEFNEETDLFDDPLITADFIVENPDLREQSSISIDIVLSNS